MTTTYRPYGARVRKQHPCPGCGTMQWAPATELCRGCLDALKVGREEVERRKEEQQAKEVVHVRAGPGWVYDALGGDLHFVDYRADDFMRDLRTLVDPTDAVVPYGSGHRDMHYRDDFYAHHPPLAGWVAPETADRLQRMLDYLSALLRHKYDEGFGRGRDLLGALASGDLTAKELSEVEAKHA